MNVGLIDVDGHSGFPNLALMKLSAWHKAHGDSVEWYQPLFATEPFDRVYMSKVFTFTPDYTVRVRGLQKSSDTDESSHTSSKRKPGQA